MKKILKIFISLINKLYMTTKGLNYINNIYYLSSISCSPNNLISINNSIFEKTKIKTFGKKNNLKINNSKLSKSLIEIYGDNNEFFLESLVNLRSADIKIIGDGCKISIGENTSCGGMRIINKGNKCIIEIGNNCLFSDNIEIWSSDTHSIYNKVNEIINPEKDVSIGNHVWIGSRVIILKGVKIGNNSVIGMGSIVTNDVPDGTISVGVPNHIIKTEINWDL